MRNSAIFNYKNNNSNNLQTKNIWAIKHPTAAKVIQTCLPVITAAAALALTSAMIPHISLDEPIAYGVFQVPLLAIASGMLLGKLLADRLFASGTSKNQQMRILSQRCKEKLKEIASSHHPEEEKKALERQTLSTWILSLCHVYQTSSDPVSEIEPLIVKQLRKFSAVSLQAQVALERGMFQNGGFELAYGIWSDAERGHPLGRFEPPDARDFLRAYQSMLS
jgi:hypothetical protein